MSLASPAAESQKHQWLDSNPIGDDVEVPTNFKSLWFRVALNFSVDIELFVDLYLSFSAPFTSLTQSKSSQALDFLCPPLQAMALYSSQVTQLCFHFLNTYSLCPSPNSSLSIHAGLLLHLLHFLQLQWTALCLQQVAHEDWPALLGLCQGNHSGDPDKQIFEEAKICSPEALGCDSL